MPAISFDLRSAIELDLVQQLASLLWRLRRADTIETGLFEMQSERPSGNRKGLTRESAVGVTSIRPAELTKPETSMTAANDLAVRRALETAGVEFIDENGSGPGVRLRKRQRTKPSK